MLPLFHLADMGFLQQLWIILYLYLVKIFYIFPYLLLQLCFYSGGRKEDKTTTDEILSYDSTSDTWNVAGKTIEPRRYYGLGLHVDVSEVCP